MKRGKTRQERTDEEDAALNRATRRLLFREQAAAIPSAGNIPGAGRSAAARPARHVRVKVTMNLDGDVVSHFKEQGEVEGRPYQTLINQILREHIEGTRPERLAREVGQMLIEDQSFLALLEKQLAAEKD